MEMRDGEGLKVSGAVHTQQPRPDLAITLDGAKRTKEAFIANPDPLSDAMTPPQLEPHMLHLLPPATPTLNAFLSLVTASSHSRADESPSTKKPFPNPSSEGRQIPHQESSFSDHTTPKGLIL